jgi:hypothetical protein
MCSHCVVNVLESRDLHVSAVGVCMERCNPRERNLRNEESHDVHTAPTIISY